MAKTTLITPKQNRPASKFDIDTSKFTYHPPEKLPADEQTIDAEGNLGTIKAEYYTDANGKKVQRNDSIYTTGDQDYGQQIETHAGPSTYEIPFKIGNQDFTGTYEENGNFRVGYGKEFYKNGHHWLPTVNAQGEISYINNDTPDSFGDFAKMVALSALTAGFGGAAGVGNSLFGLSGTAGTMAGGTVLGAGRAALTGGDILKGALTGGIGGAGNLGIGDTGFSVGQVMTAANVLNSVKNGDLMGAITGAASLSGAGSTQIGDTGYTLGDLAKNAKLAQTILSGKGNLQSIFSAITKVAGAANKDVIQSLTNAGMSGPQAKDFIQDYFAPGGEGYIEPANNGGYTSQWQKSGSDRIMIRDDGSAIAINENGESYSLSPEEVTQMIDNGQLNTEASGYVAATGGTGNTPGGSGTTIKPPTSRPPGAGTSTTGTSTTGTTSSPTVTRFGLDPLDVLKMKDGVAHINPLEELFGGSIYNQTPIKKDTSFEADVVKALEDTQGTQNYSSGGDIHALLQLLRS